MLKIKQNKKGKVLMVSIALSLIGLLIYLLIATSNLDGPTIENFGQIQKQTIRALNQKDTLLLYVDTATELAKRDVSQKILADNAGFYKEIDSSDPNSDVTGCGSHVYNLLSTTTGKSCVSDYDYGKEYLFSFKDELGKYISREENLKGVEFNHFDIDNGSIIPKNLEQVYLLITNKDFDFDFLPEGGIINLAIKSKYGDDVAKKILNIDLSKDPFKSMVPGDCSLHVNWLIKTAYQDEDNFRGIDCFPNHAWGIAACYLSKSQRTPEISRVVYSGPGLSFDELFLEDKLLKEGDILFTSSKTTWCKWTGYNEYSNDNMCGYAKGTLDPDRYLRTDGEIGFCVEDTIELSDNPLYCDFSEFGIESENFPIITHIFIYLGLDRTGKHVIGNLYGAHANDKDLEIFLGTYGKSDGVRMIVRPDYPKI